MCVCVYLHVFIFLCMCLYRYIYIPVFLLDTWHNGYRRWFPKLLRRQSSGGCRLNPDYRRVTIQEYLTLVPGYGSRNQNR